MVNGVAPLKTSLLLIFVAAAASAGAVEQTSLGGASLQPPSMSHPRLYCTPAELEDLRAKRTDGVHARIWRNISESADWCMAQPPRTEWIAPVADDPIYENLYDRFYAMMMDMAIIEHLAFAHALSGDPRYGEATRERTLACCRAWKPDAEAEPDGGKAYAVSRLIKGVAVAYDLAYGRFTPEERDELRGMLAATAGNYHQRYFTTPDKAGPGFHTHHAIVEFGSLGVVALTLLGEVPEAAEWLETTTKKFEEHLLPTGLAEDGAQVEGATFWASTMHYRLFFMDALRRVTGKNLFGPYKQYMRPDLALASVAAEKRPGWNEPHQTVIFSPPYGQLDYYAPVLLMLAREYKDTASQHLALWDQSLGHIQKTRYITPNRREQLLFELGGYAYVWYDAGVVPDPGEAALSYRFPSVGQAYARGDWRPDGLLVGLKNMGETVVHAGGTPVLIAGGIGSEPPPGSQSVTLRDAGDTAILECRFDAEPRVSMTLRRPDTLDVHWRGLDAPLSFWCLRPPKRVDDRLVWEDRVEMSAATGRLAGIDTEGYAPAHAVGNGRLTLIDPMPRKYPTVRVDPAGGEIAIRVQLIGNH